MWRLKYSPITWVRNHGAVPFDKYSPCSRARIFPTIIAILGSALSSLDTSTSLGSVSIKGRHTYVLGIWTETLRWSDMPRDVNSFRKISRALPVSSPQVQTAKTYRLANMERGRELTNMRMIFGGCQPWIGNANPTGSSGFNNDSNAIFPIVSVSILHISVASQSKRPAILVATRLVLPVPEK